MRKIEKMWIVEAVTSRSGDYSDSPVTDVSSNTCIYALCNDNSFWIIFPAREKPKWERVELPEIPQE